MNNKNKAVSLITKCVFAASVVCAAGAMAADSKETTPVFQIEPQEVPASSFKYGPFAMAMSEGTSPDIAGVFNRTDFFSFYNIAPHQTDFGQKIYRYKTCYDQSVISSFCDALWDGDSYASAWRTSFYYRLSNLKSFLNQQIYDDTEMIYTKLGDSSSEAVGYRFDYDPSLSPTIHNPTVYGIAKFNNKTFILKSPHEDRRGDSSLGSYATALTFYKMDDGRILIGGYSNKNNAVVNFFENCYNGNHHKNGDYQTCPGHKMQATVWIVDPENNADEDVIVGIHVPQYIDFSDNPGVLVSAAINGFTKVGNNLYAIGYSVTDDWGGVVNPGNTAVYWRIEVDGDKVDFKSIVEYPNVDRPGNNDNWNDYTLAVDANQNGYVLINRKLAKSSNRNYAKNMAFTRFNESGRIDDAVYPLYDTPFRGADSEGAAINDNNFIVGWAGRRDDHRAVVGGSYRDVEALFYNINNRSYNYINDLICHKNENGDKDCRAQDGKYYYISWAVDINNDNLIFATAFRYNSEKDWSNSVNAEVVPVILRPTDDAFVKDDKGNTVINQKKVVSYERPQNKNYSRDRGGCLDFISVLLLVSGAAVLRRRKRHV